MTIHLHEGQRVVFQTDAENLYIGKAAADPDPQNPGKWLIPAGCVESAPPLIPRGKKAQWVGYKWKIINP